MDATSKIKIMTYGIGCRIQTTEEKYGNCLFRIAKRWYDKLIETEQEHNAIVNHAQTRLPPRAYYTRKVEIDKHGLGIIGIRYEREPNGFARIWFPRGFNHLTNQEGQRRKAATNAGYHVSQGYDDQNNTIVQPGKPLIGLPIHTEL